MNSKSLLVLAIVSVFAFNIPAGAGTVSISQEPLFTASSENVKPNIMYILDDSGSMDWAYMPDYVNDELHCKGSSCVFSDPPFNSTMFNGIYYNPNVDYQPAVTNDGVTPMAQQFRMAGTVKRWDQVQTDPFLNPSSKVSVESIADKIFCKTSSPTNPQQDTADSTGTDCRKNGKKYGSTNVGYALPDSTYSKSISVPTSAGYKSPPYYYNMTVEWCKSNLTQCHQPKTPRATPRNTPMCHASKLLWPPVRRNAPASGRMKTR